ncbi:transposase family protein [Deinococcus peraridilitoris]|uniref:transposase family protein n=1 Tax=Deinococcus peraridilitoris TaxID=432329 RepID=UPI0002F4D149|nr:transposase family protein [Deinococcus peraridilitoris]
MEQDRLTRTLKMNRKQFRRRTGIYPETFAEMEAVLAEREAQKKKAGRPAALSVAEQLLMTLEFWREYRTFAHLGDDWGVHETTVHRTVERVEAALIASEQFQMPKKRVFQEAQTVYSIVVVDASEVPCERPKKSSAAGTAARRSSTP